jgi:hypothetical protein
MIFERVKPDIENSLAEEVEIVTPAPVPSMLTQRLEIVDEK